MKQKLFGVTLEKLLNSLGQTVYMVGIALFLGSLLGLAIALVLVLCRRGGLKENRIIYTIVKRLCQCGAECPLCDPSGYHHAAYKSRSGNHHRKYGGPCAADLLHKPIYGQAD